MKISTNKPSIKLYETIDKLCYGACLYYGSKYYKLIFDTINNTTIHFVPLFHSYIESIRLYDSSFNLKKQNITFKKKDACGLIHVYHNGDGCKNLILIDSKKTDNDIKMILSHELFSHAISLNNFNDFWNMGIKIKSEDNLINEVFTEYIARKIINISYPNYHNKLDSYGKYMFIPYFLMQYISKDLLLKSYIDNKFLFKDYYNTLIKKDAYNNLVKYINNEDFEMINREFELIKNIHR